MPSYPEGQSVNEALTIVCPMCRVEAGDWCVYLGPRPEPGLPTKRLHVERTQRAWTRRPPRIDATTRPHPVLGILREWDRREDQALRTWLARYAHLLLRQD